jgi:hypothetical protein
MSNVAGLVSAFIVVGAIVAAARGLRLVHRELPVLLAAIEALHRDVRPALVRVDAETERARARLGRR